MESWISDICFVQGAAVEEYTDKALAERGDYNILLSDTEDTQQY